MTYPPTTELERAAEYQQLVAKMVKLQKDYETSLKHQEEAYRRGYRQGWYGARAEGNEDITWQEVYQWSHLGLDERSENDYPPGSSFWWGHKKKK